MLYSGYHRISREQLHREGALPSSCPSLYVLVVPETQKTFFFLNYSEDDDSFLAAVSRGWNKHFPEITRKRERTPTGAGAGIESSSSGTELGKAQRWRDLHGFKGWISTVTCPEMLLALAWATDLGQ